MTLFWRCAARYPTVGGWEPWRAAEITLDGVRAPDGHRLWRHVERIEQAGNRVVVTAGGVIHDMRADGTAEHGVNDVSAAGHVPIQVVAVFEAGALVFRPVGIPGVEVSRRIVDGELEWRYGPSIVVRLRRA